ncbi:hypothetical protein [Paracoccus homiensis]|uniref:Uncharacterized protein n=1 Tax=Paracoccus homiensis TaxID=364199 RepID=A0A1I0JMQ7_9RHOB|nr:hypothetical protein [Paracoccus homiensis]SEU10984.1 hypothetical protein SAMN04489858_1326 [Paracoccus homiensis]
MILLFVSVMGAMAITFAIVESAAEAAETRRGVRYVMLIGWLAGTVSAGSLSLGTGWLLSGLSDEYWQHLAKSNYVWGLAIGAVVCLGSAQAAGKAI